MNNNPFNRFQPDNDGPADNHRRGRELWDNTPHNWSGRNNPNNGYENRHHGSPNYRPDHNPNQLNQPMQPEGNYGKRTQQMPYYPQDIAWRHHDEQTWTERNDFKDDDYRYRSGHRDTWHRNFEREHSDYYDNQPQNQNLHRDEGFFSNIGHGVRQTWHELTHRSPDQQTHPDNWHYENRRDRDENYNRFEERSW